jgi:uncharacterized protein YjcR
MLKSLLKEAYHFLSHLDKTGYFKAPNETPVTKTIGAFRPRGESLFSPLKGKKLTRDEAVDIYNEDRYSFSELAELYGVAVSTIYDIKFGRSWRKATGHSRAHPPLRAASTSRAVPINGRQKGFKLTRKEALEIYNDKTMSSAELGEIYGISSNSVANIKSGRTWAEATGHNQ